MPTPTEIFRAKEQFIHASELSWENDILRLQNKLWGLIGDEYIPSFNITESGNLAFTNMSRAIALDNIFDQFNREFQRNVFKKFSNELLKTADFSKEYFESLGFSKKTIENISKQTGFISKGIGIDKKGNFIKGGYLDRLGQAANVRDELKNFIINQVSTKTNLRDFQRGFKNLVVGNKDLGLSGELVKYHRQFSFDMFTQTGQVADNFYAEQLDLNFFVYAGTLIVTSRCFCIKRKGMTFHRDDLKKWKNDVALIDKKTKATYNPLRERGRYNCRHLLRWISDKMAKERGYSKAKATALLSKKCAKKKKSK